MARRIKIFDTTLRDGEQAPFDTTVCGQPSLLTTAKDNQEADIIESLLASYKVPIMKKYREAGTYLNVYMGGTLFGVDIYVPSIVLEEAQDILKNVPVEDIVPQVPDEEIITEEKTFGRCRRLKGWIILLFFIPGIIYTLILAIILVINRFFP